MTGCSILNAAVSCLSSQREAARHRHAAALLIEIAVLVLLTDLLVISFHATIHADGSHANPESACYT